jgi:hypothetical protein
MHRLHRIAAVPILALTASGCLGWSSAPRPPAPDAGAATVEGRVLTTACGGPKRDRCAPTLYRGSIVFCRTMGQSGLCPSARVDASGHYRITLRHGGRYAVLPAPASGNVVQVTPRWVDVPAGQTTTLDIDGHNLER